MKQCAEVALNFHARTSRVKGIVTPAETRTRNVFVPDCTVSGGALWQGVDISGCNLGPIFVIVRKNCSCGDQQEKSRARERNKRNGLTRRMARKYFRVLFPRDLRLHLRVSWILSLYKYIRSLLLFC